MAERTIEGEGRCPVRNHWRLERVVAARLSPGGGFRLRTVGVIMIVPIKRLPRRSCGSEVRVGVENGRRRAPCRCGVKRRSFKHRWWVGKHAVEG
jgi:hypothetical protein